MSAMTITTHNASRGVNRNDTPAAMAPTTPEPTMCPKIVSRAFVRTRSISGGMSRGVTDDFSTPNDLLITIMPSAAG